MLPLEIRFSVPGRPVSWKRHAGMGRYAHNTPEYTAFKQRVAMYGLIARADWEHRPGNLPVWPQDEEYRLQVEGSFKGRRSLPDGDNLLKAVSDALQGILWDNDRSIASKTVDRRFVRHAEEERTLIVVQILEEVLKPANDKV